MGKAPKETVGHAHGKTEGNRYAHMKRAAQPQFYAQKRAWVNMSFIGQRKITITTAAVKTVIFARLPYNIIIILLGVLAVVSRFFYITSFLFDNCSLDLILSFSVEVVEICFCLYSMMTRKTIGNFGTTHIRNTILKDSCENNAFTRVMNYFCIYFRNRT